MQHMYPMGVGVMNARKRFGIAYPTLYATAESGKKAKEIEAYNCVQRGHQNSLENQPVFLINMLLAGVRYPVCASVAGCIYLMGRVVYFMGYSSGVPNRRLYGLFFYFGTLWLVGMVGRFAFELLTSSSSSSS